MTDGIAEIRFAMRGGTTRLTHLYQRDPLRVLFPAPDENDPPLAVILTTSGGLVSGDRLDVVVEIAPGAVAHVTTSAAEKIYRSTGRTTTISQNLSVAPGAVLEFLPLETILFDGAGLQRKTVLHLGPGAAFLGGDIVVFGRRARGERFVTGFLREVWEVHKDGELVWGDALQLEDNVGSVIDDPACFDGAAAFAIMIFSPGSASAQDLIDAARIVQAAAATTALRSGATVIAGLVVARWLASDPSLLRKAYADLACHFRSAALGLPLHLPRVWHI